MFLLLFSSLLFAQDIVVIDICPYCYEDASLDNDGYFQDEPPPPDVDLEPLDFDWDFP